VYATVVQSEAYRDAKLATTAQLLPDLLGPAALPFDLRFHRPGGDGGTSVDLVLVSNDVYRLESMSGFGTRPRIDDGVLGVVTVAVDRARDLPALVAAEASGRIRGASPAIASGRRRTSSWTPGSRSSMSVSTARPCGWRRPFDSVRYPARCASASRSMRPGRRGPPCVTQADGRGARPCPVRPSRTLIGTSRKRRHPTQPRVIGCSPQLTTTPFLTPRG
jgi:hypothetical protein